MNAPLTHDVAAEVKRIADRWPDEFRLGYRFGFRRESRSSVRPSWLSARVPHVATRAKKCLVVRVQ